MRTVGLSGLALISVLLVSACSNSLVMEVDSAIPMATTDSNKAKISLYMSPDFVNYVYRENTPDRENWEISLGKSQAVMFQQILQAVYGDVSITSSVNQPEGADLVVVPKLVEMQLATPRETGFTFFEAWLSYTITIREIEDNNTRILNVTAYGKQNTERFQRFQQGLRLAIEKALRDAGAKLTVKLTRPGEAKTNVVN